MSSYADLLQAALRLSPQERAALAGDLLSSLDELSPTEADRLWAEEADGRLERYRSGQAKSVSADDVHAKARRLLG